MTVHTVNTGHDHNDGQPSGPGTDFIRNPAIVQTTAGRPVSKPLPASASGIAACDPPLAAAHRLLRSSVYREVRALTCEIHEEVLILRGQVSSWHQKQVAQEIVRDVPGIRVIVNSVKVMP